MVEIGRLNKLKIVKIRDIGAYLDGAELGEILLPKRFVTQNVKIDDEIEVFIYLDSEDRVIATTQKPFAMVGDFALLKVVSVTSVGAFLDWGLQKDVLVPFREQKKKMEAGQSVIVFIYLDEKSNRIVASSKLDRFLDNQPPDFEEGQEVQLFICGQTEMGCKAVVNKTHWGVIYKNEIFQPLKKGQHVQGFIKKIREDGKIDLTLQKSGYQKVDGISEKIISVLKKRGGFIPVTDKSSPDMIYQLFGVSKKSYKKAVGALYKKRIVAIEDEGVRLVGKK